MPYLTSLAENRLVPSEVLLSILFRRYPRWVYKKALLYILHRIEEYQSGNGNGAAHPH